METVELILSEQQISTIHAALTACSKMSNEVAELEEVFAGLDFDVLNDCTK